MADSTEPSALMSAEQIQLLRYQARLEVWKVVAGTMIVGIAVAFFPFAQKYAEVFFQTQIEQIKAKSAFDILNEQNRLELKKVDNQAEKDKEEALRMEEKALREFLNTLATEGRSTDIEARIRLAEYFSFVLPKAAEGSDWAGFRDYLLKQRAEELKRRRAALEIQLDPNSSELERELAAADVLEIDRTISPSATSSILEKVEVSYESLGIDRSTVNGDLTVPKEDFLLSLFGTPALKINDVCSFPDTEPLKSQIVSVKFGKTPVALLKPAAESLKAILERFTEKNAALASQLESLGGWCIRYRRGSPKSLSNHSFGLSMDVSYGKIFDISGNNAVSPEIAAIAPYFIEAGWYWGAGFSRDEPMHFEASEQLVQKWLSEGALLTLNQSEAGSPKAEVSEPTP